MLYCASEVGGFFGGFFGSLFLIFAMEKASKEKPASMAFVSTQLPQSEDADSDAPAAICHCNTVHGQSRS